MMSTSEERLHIAVRENDRTGMELLLTKGIDINCYYYGMTPLYIAVTKGHTDVATWLIERGADVNKAELGGHITLFEEAVKRDQVHIVKALLRKGVDVNQLLSQGDTALTYSASQARTFLSQVLIEGDAKVNLTNAHGETALWLSCQKGHTGVVELLLRAGANKNTACGPQHLTPLISSVANEHLNTTKLLIKYGCDLDIEDTGGWTALWHAVSGSNKDLVRVLVMAGADVTIRDEDGRTLMDEVMENEEDELIQILKQAR